MTYKELVDRIEDTVTRHKMLVDFGYGQLSDIKVLDNSEDGADYPYAFLLPTGISRSNQAVTYSFSLIVMEMVKEPSLTLQVQSDCIQYINDLIADLRFDVDFKGDINLTQTIQVFRERFQDEVAGATLNLQVSVADAINDCDAPIEPVFEELVNVTRVDDLTLGPDPGDNTAFTYPVNIVNNGQWQTNKYVVDETATYKFVMTQDIVFNELQPGEVYPSEPILREITTFIVRAASKSNWPTSPVAGEVYPVTMEWEADIVDTGGTVWEFLVLTDEVGQPEGTLVQKANGNLKVYKAK